MNEVIQTIRQHRSFRNYKNTPVPVDKLELVLEAAQWAPSWIHGQQVTVISIKDEDRKEKLSRLVGNQAHVNQAPVFLIFCMDFHRAFLAGEKDGKQLKALDDVDALLVGATDVGLAMSNAITVAESFGLGTVPIGGIRRNPLDVIDLLELPSYVVPISGLCLGYPDHDPGQKPRIPTSLFHHEEMYQKPSQEELDKYDEVMKEYTQTMTWSSRIAEFYEKSYYQDIAAMLKKQGFTCKNMK
ncbi:NADPH-dependent oxidoreductase [Bacillus solitudinis]|uniref:NADPH-dependent oxidoreductase n=1 Tax=Bacillus solitudinis TaxID=2014074 RepID=UPI000C24D097|nr:NADPH-dependent oxidoreductase [Bacillus solitudinis]